jgi:hypothetical protein
MGMCLYAGVMLSVMAEVLALTLNPDGKAKQPPARKCSLRDGIAPSGR